MPKDIEADLRPSLLFIKDWAHDMCALFSPGRAVVLHKQSGLRGVLFVQHSILIFVCGCDNILVSRGEGEEQPDGQ